MLINELELNARELPALHAFWAATLGLPVRVEDDGLVVETGTSRIRFRAQRDALAGVYHIAFNIPANRFAEARAWLAARVPLLIDANGVDAFDFASWNAHSVYFKDPDGNILELIARHGLANATDHQFGEQDFLAVSEIGLAVDDVAKTVGELTRSLGVPIYDGAGSDAFSAIGDEYGLFIVVANGRIWYPDTGVPAAVLPLRVTVETDAGRRVIAVSDKLNLE